MKITDGKLSNYVGQAKDNVKLDTHFVSIDRDLQNIWRILNYIAPFVGADTAELKTNTSLGYSYLPLMNAHPTTSPTAYTGHVAYVFCKSDNSFRIYNTSDSAWKLGYLSYSTNTTLTNAYIVKGGQALNTVNTTWVYTNLNGVTGWVPIWVNATP